MKESKGDAEGKIIQPRRSGDGTGVVSSNAVGQDLRRLLEKLADDKPVVSISGDDGLEVTIMKREETHDGNSMKARKPGKKEVVRSQVERIPEDILRRTTLRRKRVPFKEEIEHLGLDQESGEWQPPERDGEEENLSGDSEEWDEGSEKSADEQDSLCMILTEEGGITTGNSRLILRQRHTTWSIMT